ncbi:IclR family transcriptional regulator [Haladaptatus sp. T7]|uniref:IclR family transcriptional regulator n=1 Tax=Haladaptatus sp. T7 TaxID=2029368 RepID=UPI0021A25B51|nr:IclR family transcriptional regulator [Haladaptatus sp. T7]GKZ15194.1 IclR family transcriptional regulator [Haladaptatus sp. T7]
MCKHNRVRVKSTATTFDVIDSLKELDHPGLTEVAEFLGVPKSTAHDYLSTLIELDFVVKEPEGYRLGARFLEYGGYARESMKVYRVARPVVNRLAEETGEHANLMIEEHGLGIFLYKAKGDDAVNLDTHPGMRVPLQTTALGKTILAHLPEDEVRRIVNEHGLPAVTEKTITDRGALFDELEGIRERGYATDDEERVEGMRCIAAPVVNQNDVIAAVSVSGPMSRMHDERFENDVPRRVLSAANVIEVNMTYS